MRMMGRKRYARGAQPVLAAVMTVDSVWLLASVGTPWALVLAVCCAAFPLAAWLQARKLRERGTDDAALLQCTVAAAAMFMLLVNWAVNWALSGDVPRH